ncbi:15-cis-phytoene desaturase, chloroplastic/chromoplastic, partial [Tanacetum coccineum]
LDIDDSDVHLTHVLRSSSSAHVEPSSYTPNPVTIIPGPAGVVELSNSIYVEQSSSTPNPVRIIPGPAGLVQRAKLLKENVFILDPDGALMPTQEYMQKVIEDVGKDADFNSGVWGKLEQVVAIVKSCSPNALGDLNVTLKDLSGTVPGTIHYKVLNMSSYEKDITVGAAMILVNATRHLFSNQVHPEAYSRKHTYMNNIGDSFEFSRVCIVMLTVKSEFVTAGMFRVFGEEIVELSIVAISEPYKQKV